jgi:hypothetical protein
MIRFIQSSSLIGRVQQMRHFQFESAAIHLCGLRIIVYFLVILMRPGCTAMDRHDNATELDSSLTL